MREKHLFHFTAGKIAVAAHQEAEYHEGRLTYWQGEYDKAVVVVERTIGAKVEKQPITGGYTVAVVVNYGDPAAFRRMQDAFAKIASHRAAAERFRSDYALYGSQDNRSYELDAEDVHHFRLGGEPREE